MFTRVIGNTSTLEFTVLFRSWRDRRRMSQLDLAVTAGTTQRHLSFIEQGRSVPGRSMVARLAESLALPLRERNELLLAAGFAPAFAESPFDGALLATIRASLQQILDGHQSFPPLVVDAGGFIVAHNDAFRVLSDGADPALLRSPVNGLRLALHPAGMSSRIVNFPEWAPHVIDNLRRSIATNPDPRRVALLDELTGYVPALPLSSNHLGFAVPMQLQTNEGVLSLVTTAMHFATANDVTVSELRLESFLPTNEETSAALVRLAARPR